MAKTLHVLVAGVWHEVVLARLLDFFWRPAHSNDRSTLCLVCSRGFQDRTLGPSIRTYSVDEENYDDGTQIRHIRLHDRHMSCIREAKIDYVAVSHVWHEPVRRAHMNGRPADQRSDQSDVSEEDHSRRLDQATLKEASELVYTVPLEILKSSRRAFGPGVEIWHDYLSVSQWNFESQQQLLLLIPDIYRVPTRNIVHLADYPPHHIHLMWEFESLLDADIENKDRMKERYDAVMAFYQTRYMERVWVVLESTRSRRACVMDSEYNIWKVPGADTGSFPWLDREIRRNYILVYSYFPEYREKILKVRYISRGLDSHFPGRSLGDTLDELATRRCTYHRDRFIAIHASLGVSGYAATALEIPRDSAGACRWVWTRALARGDYSPLLMQRVGTTEKEAFGLSWLVGHEEMNFHTWDLGRPVSQPTRHTIIRNGEIEPELEYIGSVQSSASLPLDNGSLAGLEAFVVMYVSLDGWTSAGFVSTMERIFPILQFAKIYAKDGKPGYKTIPTSLEQYLQEDPQFEAKLGDLLRSFETEIQSLSSAHQARRAQLVQELADLMQLDRSFGPMANDTRLRDLNKRFEHLKRLDPKWTETICTVACEHCRGVFLFRPELRHPAARARGAKLYRIPGLAYAMTIEEGVGLVVQDGRIIGRMQYASPACACRRSELVRIT